jgi:adenylate cyclase
MTTGVEMREGETAGAVAETGAGQQFGTELCRRLRRSLVIRAFLANLMGAVPLILLGGVYVQRLTERNPGVPLFWLGLAMVVVLMLPMLAGFLWLTKRLLERATSWIGVRRVPTDDDRRAAARVTTGLTLWSAPWWASACVIANAVIFALGVDALFSELLVGTIGILLGGVVSCGLCYLLFEDANRPLLRLVLTPEDYPRNDGLGIRSRLVVYWLVGSGAYLFGIALILLAFPAEAARPIAIASCALGGFVGFVMTNLSAASITRPLDRVRAGMEQVESGDLSVAVLIDDLGEVGLLQSGFNRMLAGLRDRERIRELFGRHVGREVVQRALSRGAGLEGGERNVSVLFVDVIGSTSLAIERPPTAVVETLNALFEAVVRTVSREGGFVNQFQGDGALCLFGAPDPLEDHAARALRAARLLRTEIDALSERYPGFGAAIGVSTGRAVAGDIGTEDRHEYTVIGDPVNEASRLCDEAKQRSSRVLASKATLDEARADVSGWISGGEIALRGRRRPTVVYEPPV